MQKEISLTQGIGWELPPSSAPALRVCMGYLPHHGALRPISVPPNCWEPTGHSACDLPELPPFPVLEFALKREASLVITEAINVSASLAPLSAMGGSGSGASATHSSVQANWEESAASSKAVMQAYLNAVAEQAESQGLFHQPFLVRYALRLANGKHILPSSPALMLCAALPPCLVATNIQSTDQAGINSLVLSGSKYPLFKLRCRILEGIPQEWENQILGIDIYASAPIMTYDTSRISHKGLQSYSDICQGAIMGANRGRAEALSESDILAGAWSEGDGASVNRSLADMGAASSMAWHLNPNPALAQELVKTAAFYHICHLPLSQVQSGDVFFDLPIGNSGTETLKANPILEDCESSWMKYAPAISIKHQSMMVMAGGNISPVSPLPLRSLGAFIGGFAAQPLAQARIISVAACQGDIATSETNCLGIAASLGVALPRYIYHPDPHCRQLIVEQGAELCIIPMIPHPTMPGSYWMGSLLCLDHASALLASEMPLLDYPQAITASNALAVTALDNPYCYSSFTEIGQGAILALHNATRAMSAGQFGQHPIYAFCSDGVWALRFGSNGYEGAHKLNSNSCISAQAIAKVADSDSESIAYLCREGLMLLAGSKSCCISDDVFNPDSMALDIQLPHWEQLALGQAFPAFNQILPDSQLYWDSENSVIFVANPSLEFAYCYSMQSKKWGMASRAQRQHDLILTQPWCADGQPIRSIEAKGRYGANELKLAVYGSHDLRHWTLCGSSVTGRAHPLMGTPYEYYVAALCLDTAVRDMALWSIEIKS